MSILSTNDHITLIFLDVPSNTVASCLLDSGCWMDHKPWWKLFSIAQHVIKSSHLSSWKTRL